MDAGITTSKPIWNKLPDAVVVAESVGIFKGEIAHYQSACGGLVKA